MKTNKSVVKTLMAIAIMFGCANTAHAQFGNIIDKATKTVTGTAEHMADKALEKAQ